jgi:type II secretory pathway predicted ATPase ExeA
MLCNMLQSRLPDNVESVYLANPSVAADEVLHAIAFELQLGVDRHADRLEVMHCLQDYLVQRHAEGKRVVVFIEESQSMPVATLEEIRLLSNLETRTDKLLQIVLFGQPELDEILRRPDIRQLRDRIAHSFRLEPLTHDQVRAYLTFRMRAAGYRGPDVFSPKVVKQIAEAADGLTRRVNLIADKALLAAFSENTHTIHSRHVEAALRDSDFSQRRRIRAFRPPVMATAALLAGGVLGAVIYATLGARFGQLAPNAAALAGGARAQWASSESSSVIETTQPAPLSAFAESVSRPSLASGEDSNAPAVQRASFKPSTTDIVASRLEATKTWATSARPDSYSIQLFVAAGDAQLRNHLNTLSKYVENNDIYMYRGAAQGGSRLVVLWGAYETRTAALNALEELPASLLANRPYVRTLESVRSEMERYAASQ